MGIHKSIEFNQCDLEGENRSEFIQAIKSLVEEVKQDA